MVKSIRYRSPRTAQDLVDLWIFPTSNERLVYFLCSLTDPIHKKPIFGGKFFIHWSDVRCERKYSASSWVIHSCHTSSSSFIVRKKKKNRLIIAILWIVCQSAHARLLITGSSSKVSTIYIFSKLQLADYVKSKEREGKFRKEKLFSFAYGLLF